MQRILRRSLTATAAAGIVGSILTTLVVGNGSAPVRATSLDSALSANTVSVNGMGRLTGTPDVLSLQMGVQRNGRVVNDVLGEANADVERITTALRKHGVAAKDVATSNLSINPFWDDNRINGYEVTESLTIKLRDLAKAGPAISEAAAAGGNATRINGVAFDIEDNAELINAARERAFADAKAKAEQYAKLAGRSLGRVSQVSESTESSSAPMPYYAARDSAATAAKVDVPISPGTQQVTVNTAVVWELN